jgi:hypothetical protein
MTPQARTFQYWLFSVVESPPVPRACSIHESGARQNNRAIAGRTWWVWSWLKIVGQITVSQ